MMSPACSLQLGRGEVDAWKRALRVLHHELTNSLAPVLSLAQTGRALVRRSPSEERLDLLFATIADRAQHLCAFLDGYAALARVPAPRLQPTAWRILLERLSTMVAFRFSLSCDELVTAVDRGQVEQLIINVVRNAVEAGSPADEIAVHVAAEPDGARLFVRDRGPGMDEATLARAHLPFFSTKAGGTGLGLALAREIAQGHGGDLWLRNRPGGGLEVEVSLPAAAAPG